MVTLSTHTKKKDPKKEKWQRREVQSVSFEGRLYTIASGETSDIACKLSEAQDLEHENINSPYPHGVLIRIKHMYRCVLGLTHG